MIVFVRGGGANLARVVEAGIADAIALDWTFEPDLLLPELPEGLATQGNLDPLAPFRNGALRICQDLQIVNLRPAVPSPIGSAPAGRRRCEGAVDGLAAPQFSLQEKQQKRRLKFPFF